MLIDCSIRAVLAELQERGNPGGDIPDESDDTHDDAALRRDGRERLA